MSKEQPVSTILVGKKPLMNYVLACLTSLQGGSNNLVVKARGRAISKAVDLVQILQKRFYKDLKIVDIKIGTDQVTGQDNRTINVSTIEITISR
ncbi:MAG: DNA-binding protein Alba [Thaumarchaeota archaeon]|jgi:DNA-binding protein|nr:DNA-binding protein Alba [Candidatus Terraquivivens yellowstonensis]MCL7387340.1 DNA-binding protein Alba [Candidatus Terraquivivens yellowstonensis]MCL7392463.1 DNA-binding protein Alba [Candidatus Terraquivivens yellowstonensis]MCL7394684.1 DNA-binding protein Alba [Candidatus Terraquivivens yellowstonensis]MCL7398443.1 DNA-binding protein Alba [Candidatus Terraquivivens yellowstonensis]